jgi:hypothetical protein
MCGNHRGLRVRITSLSVQVEEGALWVEAGA